MDEVFRRAGDAGDGQVCVLVVRRVDSRPPIDVLASVGASIDEAPHQRIYARGSARFPCAMSKSAAAVQAARVILSHTDFALRTISRFSAAPCRQMINHG